MPESFAIAHTTPPMLNGTSASHTLMSQTIRRRSCRLCSASSFRWRSGSLAEFGGLSCSEAADGRLNGFGDVGMMMESGRRMK